ncbi:MULTISPECIES: DegV family protein [unclassified Romboutsia]|uniref:DegV family protein n=1 Tax=unclassified Romboutsia TaxID=2626894 RepID=UPI0008210DC2|nr:MULTISPECIES: DegV family protein [unclassified Romboutsia]SCH14370.1 Fatty acid-binding protein TM_1468 [uncultured Clostridium sp.]
MSKIKILVDGGCDLPQEILKKYDINVVGLNVSFGNDESFIAGEEIDNETFYKRMGEMKELPKTSCPSPDRFLEAYKGEGDILLLSVSSKLSGTYSSAKLAKDMYDSDFADKKIEIIDTLNGSIGQGLLAIKAAELVLQGKSLEEIVEEIEKIKDDVIFYGTLETLENAIKGGRINPLAGKIINTLNLKAIVQITEGVVKPIDKARGLNNSLKKVLEYIDKNLENVEDKTIIIGHAHCSDKAIKIKEVLANKYNAKKIIISEVGPVMGTYASQGAILVSYL